MKKLIKLSIIIIFMIAVVIPTLLVGITNLIFPEQAKGSLLYDGDTLVGSKLIGQAYYGEGYFHSRPSAIDYNMNSKVIASGSNNYASGDPQLRQRVKTTIETIKKENNLSERQDIPVDLISESASGLDPNISMQAAMIQVERISKYHQLDKKELQSMIEDNQDNDLVNVVSLNLQLKQYINKKR